MRVKLSSKNWPSIGKNACIYARTSSWLAILIPFRHKGTNSEDNTRKLGVVDDLKGRNIP